MKKHKTFALFAVLVFTALSCTQPPPPAPPQALILDLRSPNCAPVEGFLTYENDSIQVAYVFWGENGLVGVFVHNKLRQPLYLDWKKCSFITGTTKHDYWDETVTMTANGSSATSASYWESFFDNNRSSRAARNQSSGTADGYGTSFSNTFWSSVTSISRAERITFIPPGTTISRTFNSISANPIGLLDKANLLQKDTTFEGASAQVRVPRYVKYEGTTYESDSLGVGPFTAHLSYARYVPENTPLTFRIFMTYSTNDKFNTEAFIDNQFYVDQITQLTLSSFNTTKADSSNSRNIWASPNSFYVIE